MLKLSSPQFAEILATLDKVDAGTRVAFFSEESADKFLVWWFYYYGKEFMTPLADFHYDWIEAMFSGKNVFIEGFRGSIKTSITLAVITYRIAIKASDFTVWQSFDSGSSTRSTTQIALKLMNPKLEADYGEIFTVSGGRSELEKRSVGDFDTKNGVKVLATSLGEKLRGAISKNARPDTLVLDDIDVTDSVRNAEVIKKNCEKINGETIGSMNKQKNKIIFLGNTINMDGVVPRFAKEKMNDPNWVIFRQPLIDSEGKISWDFFTEEMVAKIRSNEGPKAFSQNYLLEPIDVFENGMVKFDDLRFYEEIDTNRIEKVYMHADTTHTGKTTSDFFACGVLGEADDGNFYLLDFVLDKYDVEKQARTYITMYMKWGKKVQKMTYDEKSNQGFGFWVKKMAKEEYGISLPLVEQNYSRDKVSHFEPCVPHFKSNRVYFPTNHPQMAEAQNQLLSFPVKGVNDDFVDLLSGVLSNYNTGDRLFFDKETTEMQVTQHVLLSKNGWKYYEKKKDSHKYVMGCSIALDRASMIVIDCTTKKVVADYYSEGATPTEVGDELSEKGYLYNTAFIGVKADKYGMSAISILRDKNYPSIYLNVDQTTFEDDESERLGVYLTPKTKSVIMGQLSLGLKRFTIQVVSSLLKEELLRYPKDNAELLDDNYISVESLAIAYDMIVKSGMNSPKLTIS